MGENDIRDLKEDIKEINKKIDTLVNSIADLRVVLVGEYVKRSDFEEYKTKQDEKNKHLNDKIDTKAEEIRADRFKFAGLTVTASSFIFGLIQWVVQLMK